MLARLVLGSERMHDDESRREFHPLNALSNATITGVARSAARGVLVFSRHGYDMFNQHGDVRITRRFVLEGPQLLSVLHEEKLVA